MKKLLLSYSFDASEKKVTFTDFTTIDLERVLMITNVTDNIIIYLFKTPTKGGTVSGNILTLTYDTSTMSDSDDLQIFYDDVYYDTLTDALYELISRLDPLAGAIAMVGGQALRTQGVGTFAVSGPLTTAQLTTSYGVGGGNFQNAMAGQNLTAYLTNINNCTWGE